MAWMHTWTGLLLGWVLLAIFFTGTLAYFQGEITRWMQPDLQNRAVPDTALAQAQDFLSSSAPQSNQWSITLPNDRYWMTTLYWRSNNDDKRGFERATLDGNGNPSTARDTQGGYFLYRFHFDLHYMPVMWARWIVGVCSMLMLLAIISGVIIHKKIFKDFFTLQWRKGFRSWLDSHTISSVLALPFHLMITYTGLITLMLMYMSSAISLVYDDRNEFISALEKREPLPFSDDNSDAEMTNLQQLYFDAKAKLGGASIAFASVSHPFQQRATITFYEAPTNTLVPDRRTLTYSAVSGNLLTTKQLTSAAEQTRHTMINLHSGRFAGTPLRWLYFISGLLGTLMIATGLILWLEKRKKKFSNQRRLPLGHRVVNTLNAGFIMGLPLATVAYFISNRLLPLNLANRSDWEIHSFFAGWAAMIMYAFVAGPARTWRHGAWVVGIGLISLPMIGMVKLNTHLLNYSKAKDSVLFFTDIGIFSSGLLFLFIGYWLSLHFKGGKPSE